MPCADRIPLITSLYLPGEAEPKSIQGVASRVAQMINSLAPTNGQLAGELPDPALGHSILMLCHSAQTAREAISLSDERPVIVWGWLLSESLVDELQERVPVVFGDLSTPEAAARLESLTPSRTDPLRELTGICRAVDHNWGIPPLDEDDR